MEFLNIDCPTGSVCSRSQKWHVCDSHGRGVVLHKYLTGKTQMVPKILAQNVVRTLLSFCLRYVRVCQIWLNDCEIHNKTIWIFVSELSEASSNLNILRPWWWIVNSFVLHTHVDTYISTFIIGIYHCNQLDAHLTMFRCSGNQHKQQTTHWIITCQSDGRNVC